MKYIYLLIAVLLTGCSHLSFTIQNDILGHTDNNFTNGAEFRYAQKPSDLSSSAKDLLDYIPVPRLRNDDPRKTSRYVFGLRQDMYTPNDIDTGELLKDQNPYAGTLTFDTERILADDTMRISTKLRIGTSGHPSLADATQKFVHDGLTTLGAQQQHPMGWRHQVEAEPLLNLDYERAWEDTRVKLYGIDFVEQGSTLTRLGNINTDITFTYGWKVGYDIPDLNNETEKHFTAYLSADVFSSARLQNIYYTGGIFRDSPQTVDLEPLQNGAEAGITVGYDNYIIRFITNVETKEYKQQDARYHIYGGLTFGVSW